MAGAMIALQGGCSANGAAGGQAAPPEAAPVRVATVTQEDVPLTLDAIGTVEPFQTVTIRPRVEGQLTEIHFTEGQQVNIGDRLYTIDPRPYEAALQMTEAQLAKDTAMSADARNEANRIASLFKDRTAAEREFNSTQALASAAEAQVQLDEAALQRARLNVEFCEIRSPIQGRIGAKMADVGNVVKINETPLVVINQIEPINVAFSVAERHLSTVREHFNAGKLAVEASIPNEEKAIEIGELTFINNEVDRTTGMFRAKAVFVNAQRRLWPGQFANVTLTLTQRRGAIVMPAQAVQNGPTGTFVFVVKKDQTVEMRTVKASEAEDDRVVVESGLSAGEIVVTEGQLRLTPGALVDIKTATSKPAEVSR